MKETEMSKRFVTFLGTFVAAAAVCLLPATAGEYYLNPTGGSMANPGTAAEPWPALEAVAAAGRTFAAGDVLILMAGHHGSPRLTNANADYVTVRPQPGARATLKSLAFASSARFWRIQALEISPETAPTYSRVALIEMSGASDNIVEGCQAYSVMDSTGWSSTDWHTITCDALNASGSRNTIRNNTFRNVYWGIQVAGDHNLIQRNTVDRFAGDGLRGNGNYLTFEYNLVKNHFTTDDNHADGFQAWTTGPGGVGTGVLRGNVLRGNVIIEFDDPNLPFRGYLEGMGCFDGFYEDWVVENNVIVVDHWHGIAFYGARNCKFLNNTVVDINRSNAGPPWIKVTAHKNGTPSTGNLVRNNMISDLQIDAGAATVDHNLITTAYESHFVDWPGQDLRLRAGSAAIDAGSADQAPATDALELPRPVDGNNDGTAAWDLGAYEYGAGSPTAPAITTQPQSTSRPAGQTATFSVTATGTAPLSYQWQKDQANIVGATTSTHTTPATTPADNGAKFRCVVTNDYGTATSDDATLTVTAPDSTPPTVALTAPVAGATVANAVTVSADASDNVGVAGVQFKLDGANLGAEDTSAPYAVSWDTWTAANGSHTLTAVARDAAGNTASAAAVTVAVANSGITIFTTQAPASTGNTDGPSVNYELGTRFTSAVAGQLTAVRFWKDAAESGTHTGRIWSAAGTQLAAVTFTGETASGWQVASLATPLAIAAATEYTVSVNTAGTYYVATNEGLAGAVVNGPLRTVVGVNGVYGSVGTFPTSSWQHSNYFRDVVFVAGGGGGNSPPVIDSPAWADPNPVTLPAGVTVHVVATDPDGDPLTYAWSQVSGPGTATFAAASAADSGVTFSAAGAYVLRVTVGDDQGASVTSDVSVTVISDVDARADLNHDGVVNALDLQIVIANFGKTVGSPGCDARADANGDGVVNAIDLQLVIANFGKTVPANEAPSADAQSVSATAGTATAITLTGSDPDGDALTYTVLTQPAHGTLAGAAPSLTYTATVGYVGADSFTFKVSDGALDSAPAAVSIAVTVGDEQPTRANTGPRTTDLVNMTPLEALNAYGTTVTGRRITGGLSFSAPTYWNHIGPDPRGKTYTFVDCEIQGEVFVMTATDHESGNGTLTPDALMVTLNMSYCSAAGGISSAAGYKGTIDHCSFNDKSRWAVNDTYNPSAAAPGHTFHVLQNCYFWAPYQTQPSHYEVMQNFTKVAGLTVTNCTFEQQGGPLANTGITGIINGAFAPDNVFDHCYFLWDGAAAAYYSLYAAGNGTFRNCFIEDGTAYLYPGSQCTFTNCRSYTTGNLLTLP